MQSLHELIVNFKSANNFLCIRHIKITIVIQSAEQGCDKTRNVRNNKKEIYSD